MSHVSAERFAELAKGIISNPPTERVYILATNKLDPTQLHTNLVHTAHGRWRVSRVRVVRLRLESKSLRRLPCFENHPAHTFRKCKQTHSKHYPFVCLPTSWRCSRAIFSRVYTSVLTLVVVLFFIILLRGSPLGEHSRFENNYIRKKIYTNFSIPYIWSRRILENPCRVHDGNNDNTYYRYDKRHKKFSS